MNVSSVVVQAALPRPALSLECGEGHAWALSKSSGRLLFQVCRLRAGEQAGEPPK